MKTNNLNKNSEPTTYNGWTNFETWQVALWIDNDKRLYECAQYCGRYNYSFEAFKSVVRNWKGDWQSDIKNWDNPLINVDEINEKIREFKNDNY